MQVFTNMYVSDSLRENTLYLMFVSQEVDGNIRKWNRHIDPFSINCFLIFQVHRWAAAHPIMFWGIGRKTMLIGQKLLYSK